MRTVIVICGIFFILLTLKCGEEIRGLFDNFIGSGSLIEEAEASRYMANQDVEISDICKIWCADIVDKVVDTCVDGLGRVTETYKTMENICACDIIECTNKLEVCKENLKSENSNKLNTCIEKLDECENKLRDYDAYI